MVNNTFSGASVNISTRESPVSWSKEAVFGLMEKVMDKEVLGNVKHCSYHKKTLEKKKKKIDKIFKNQSKTSMRGSSVFR